MAIDGGIKYNMIRNMVERGAEVHLMPYDYDINANLDAFDGLFLSNGPGDPATCVETINSLKDVLKREGDDIRPIFGICLGNQLVSLAAGARTLKLPFGNRGQNQPVLNVQTGECYITPQNHGYAVDSETLPDEWETLFVNANDGSNEGVRHKAKPYFTAQFHPEAACGPVDTRFLFDVFLQTCRDKAKTAAGVKFPAPRPAPPRPKVEKVLVLGSGGLSIGQAGEFDYSGNQAIKALKEEGKQVILMNPNIASVQTNVDDKSPTRADQVFFLPVTVPFVEQVIKRERPDGILISMGGQTALNCGVALNDAGILEKYGVAVLGTSVETIVATEDREIFANKLIEIEEKIAPSIAVSTIEDTMDAADRIGYPVMIRSAFALGGLGSGICEDPEGLRDMAGKALAVAPQILVEKSLKGWKEVEYEVVRDAADNCVTVCNMENFDPLGVHTGDSIVIAPSQTLSNEEYHMLRETAIKVVRHLGIVGECNIQYALDPKSLDYCIIEVNARLSRSSALASKATGYPLAFVAAKLGLGMTLPEIRNAVTKSTQACFEPSLDYCVTKIPRWDLTKFTNVSTDIGSSMKSVGEVMGIGRTWEESLQKAFRMVDPGIRGFETKRTQTPESLDTVKHVLEYPSDMRPYLIAQVLQDKSMSVGEIHSYSKIDHWFLRRLERIVRFREVLAGFEDLASVDKGSMREAKQLGFSDEQIALAVGAASALDVRDARKALGVRPFVKQIDTLAAEYPAQTNYLYMTYHGDEDDVAPNEGGTMVLGSGTYRIGSSVEFDWCGVSALRSLTAAGERTVMVNYNPETVSTDYDECDQLYFEELSLERVLDVYDQESARGIVVSVGGQIPNNLAMPLHRAGAKILGTSPEMIDNAEDRFKFSAMVDRIGCQQPAWKELAAMQDAVNFANEVGYPVLVRPSYVLSGAAMKVAFNEDQLTAFLQTAVDVSPEHPVVVSKFIDGAKEVEMDAVAKDGEVLAAAVHEHVENAGVHSGDATLMLPTQNISNYTKWRITDATAKVAKELNITGPFNMQFICKGTDVMIIECNLRASRSFPFVSKTMNVDFIEAATKLMIDKDVSDLDLPALGDFSRPKDYVGVKAPMFSFTRLRGADPVLGVEMASTGEVACFGVNVKEAFLKALLSTNFQMPRKNILCSVQKDLMPQFVHCAYDLVDQGYVLHATKKTYDALQENRIPATLVEYPTADVEPNVSTLLKNKSVCLVVNIPTPFSEKIEDNYIMRRTAVDFGIPLITNINLVKMFSDAVVAHGKEEMIGLRPDSLFDYYQNEDPSEAWTGPDQFH
eukprot:scaffold1439_cov282-Pinguiococcus_pyrenoidosus.AAC.4